MTDTQAIPYVEQLHEVRGTTIRVLSAGEGPPLLYLHGAGDPGSWSPALSGLAEFKTVLRPDHPGFNGSADDARIDTVQELAFFYVDYLGSIGIKSVSVVGVSLGGWIAAELASIAPDLVEKLVLVGADGIRVEDHPIPDYFVMDPATIARHTYFDPDRRSEAVAAAEALSDDLDALRAYLRRRAATAHLGWNPLLHDPKLPERLHRVKAPTLLVWGEHDELCPPGIGAAYATLIPNARFEVVADAGHLPHIEQAKNFLDLVVPFLG